MSSKKTTQKIDQQKPESEISEEALSLQETTEEDQQDGSDQAEQLDATEVPAVIETIAEEPVIADQPVIVATDGLATRLSKTVNAIQTSGQPDTVHALHKIEMIAGSLKVAIPAAVEASKDINDEGLTADLQSLLAVL